MIVKVYDQSCIAIPKSPLVAGTAEKHTAEFQFSSNWDGLEKIAVFEASEGIRRVMEIIDNKCDVPWEMLSRPGFLKVGVIGVHEDTRLPTIWSPPMRIIPGAVSTHSPSGGYSKSFLESTLEACRAILAKVNEGALDVGVALQECREILDRILGAIYTPHISAEGVLSWTNTAGLPNPDPVNIMGPQGVGIANFERTGILPGIPALDFGTISAADFVYNDNFNSYDTSVDVDEADLIIPGEIYSVTIDGTTYPNVTAKENGALGGPVDDGPFFDEYPFYFFNDTGEGYHIDISLPTNGPHTIEVSRVAGYTYTFTMSNGDTYSFTVKNGVNGTNGVDGVDGVDGAPGQGVPVGGTSGQVLAKNSNTNYDTHWIDPPTGAMYVHLTKDQYDVWSADKTVQEIVEANADGTPVVLYGDFVNFGIDFFVLLSTAVSSGGVYAVAASVSGGRATISGQPAMAIYNIGGSNTGLGDSWTVEEDDFIVFPDPADVDNPLSDGTIMQVQYGAWAPTSGVSAADVPASASISSGVISFKNSSNTTLFTLTLPVYNGGVS